MTTTPKLTRRPPDHFLDLAHIQHISATAWDLASIDRAQYGNALRVQVQLSTGLRVAELHALQPEDVNHDGTLTVTRGKGAKPRTTVFLDGGRDSPTLKLLLSYIQGEGRSRGGKTTLRPCRPGRPIFLTGTHAYSHWVVHRLGPASGLQRRITLLNGGTAPRYLIRTHLFRACFVVMARRLPRTLGRAPLAWDTIAHWMGHESADMTRGRYWYADEDELLDELREALPADSLPRIHRPQPRFKWQAASDGDEH